MAETVKEKTRSKMHDQTQTDGAFDLLKKENGVAFLTFDAKDEKVNILTSKVMQELDGLLDELKTETSIKALVFISGKEDNFIAGADVAEIGRASCRERV